MRQRNEKNVFVRFFTLIELLVVIAITAILAGMLLPALNSARDRGRTISCMSLMNNMMKGMLMYADDFNGRMVPRKSPAQDSTYSYNCWTTNFPFQQYAGVVSLKNYPQLWKRQYACPSKPIQGTSFYPDKVWGVQTIPSIWDWSDKVTDSGPIAKGGLPLNQVWSPASKIALIECITGSGVRDQTPTAMETWLAYGEKGNGYDNYLTFRHNGGKASNNAFYDGHVETIAGNNMRDIVPSAVNLRLYYERKPVP